MTDDDRETLTAYLDGELDEAAEQALETRLSQDPKLRAELDAMKQTWGMLDFLPKAAPSTDFTNRTIDRLSMEGRGAQSTSARRPSRRPIVWAVSAFVALLIGVAVSASYRRFLEKPIGPDEPVVRNLRVIERLPVYENLEDLEFLKSLDHPDLFGDDGT